MSKSPEGGGEGDARMQVLEELRMHSSMCDRPGSSQPWLLKVTKQAAREQQNLCEDFNRIMKSPHMLSSEEHRVVYRIWLQIQIHQNRREEHNLVNKLEPHIGTHRTGSAARSTGWCTGSGCRSSSGSP